MSMSIDYQFHWLDFLGTKTFVPWLVLNLPTVKKVSTATLKVDFMCDKL